MSECMCMGDMSALGMHELYCPLNPGGAIARADREAKRFRLQLEERAKAMIQELIRAEVEPIRVEFEARLAALESAARRDTVPAPSPDSWSGASVVPRGSSRPPAQGCTECEMLACVCSLRLAPLGPDMLEGGHE